MPGRAGRSALVAALIAGCLCLVVAPSPVQAAGPELVGGTISPAQGTTATSFVFVVDYASSPARDALSVRAEIEDTDIALDLALIDGDAASGTWRAVSTLPPGTWTVTFRADAAFGADPSLRMSDAVDVTQATPQPTVTPAPTLRPTSRPTPRPTAVPTPPPTPRPPPPAAAPTAIAPTTAAPFTSPAAESPRASDVTESSTTERPSASAGPSTASPVIVAGRSGATPGAATPAAEPASDATAPPDAPVTPAAGSIGRNALLLLGGSLAVLGSAVLARQWLRRRPPPGPER